MTNYFQFCIKNYLLLYYLLFVIMQVNGTNETRTRTSRAKNSNIVDRRMYFAIAVSPQAHDSETGGSVTSFTRAFNKTLSNITQSFWSHKNLDDITTDSKGENVFTYNITLEPLVIDLPENGAFSSNFLERLCVQLEGRHVAAMLIVGSSPAAFTVALVASSSSVPILWARGYSNFMTTLTHRDMHPYEIYLEPSAYETLQALRSLFLQTHWHSFTILADDSTTSTILLRRELSSILSTPPLNPTISYLPRNANTHAIFRRLADISRATRGVVILMSDLLQARRVLDEAKRLNMVDGHFVWLWLDTGGSTNNINPPITEHSNINPHIISSAFSSSAAASSSSIINNDFSSKNTDDTNYSQEQDGRASLTINSNSEKNRLKRDLIKNVHKLNNKSNLINFSDIINSLINNLQSDIGNVPQIQTNLNNINKSSTESTLPSPPQQITKNLNNRVPNKMYYHTEDMWPTIKTQRSRDKRQTIMTSYGMTQNNENYLLKNDKFLLFNNFNNLETNKKKNRVIFTSSKNNKYKHSGSSGSGGINNDDDDDDLFNDDEFKNDLPVGLLAIKVQPLKLDRHLIKGAVRLLAITLRNVLAKCPPEWIVTRTVQVKEWYASCWHNFPFSNNADFNKFNSDGSAGVKSAGKSDDGVNSGGKYKDNNNNNINNNNNNNSTISSASLYGAQGNFSLLFARELKLAVQDALAGHKFLQENGVEKVDKSLVSNFEITNLVPVEVFNSDNQQNLDINAQEKLTWRTVGRISGRSVHLDTIVWPGGDIVVSGLSTRPRSVFRVVTALAPPFVMESELDEDGQCLRGLPCHRVLTSDKDNLTLVFNEMETHERLEEEEDENSGSTNPFDFRHSSTPNDYIDKNGFLPFQRYKYRTNCCYGLAMDLLENIAQELEFDFRLYIVADGLFGTQIRTKKSKRDLSILTKKSLKSRYFRDGIYKHFGKEFRQSIDDFEDDENDEDYDNTNVKWNGIVGDLVSGAAHMSFAALSVSSIRSEVIDFSAPFFFSGVSFLAAPQQKTEIPLFSFLLPFSTELWIAIFTSLNITAIAVAVYEWLSPFGLNPWGRQRSKNFSMSSALWVMWGLLCGHLVAFKAPKSWPNKFLINVWGGFSVIFVASYTANIAALIAGLFFHNAVSNYHDRSLLSQKVGAPMSSAAEYYVQRANRHLWDHMSKYRLENVEEGVRKLRNGSLDILIADTPILDYYRATDHGCKLQKIGDTINEDAYGVGMTKGFPLKDSISAVIAKYSSNGYMDILQEKWYGGLPCFKLATDMAQPRPLGVAAVAGVFISLGVGMLVGCVILIVEHLFYRYTLPILRHKPKGTIWRSRNIMFFSQKLYRFINCVELVSPHHAARELVHTIRQGQITSLFQKSVKRKEHEQRRRRKSKAQFFEMIQEIRRVQQEERDLSTLESVTEMEIEEDPDEEDLASGDEKRSKLSPNILRRHFRRSNPKIDTSSPNIIKSPAKRLFVKQLFSPRAKMKQSKSSSTLNVRRFSTDSVLSNTFNTSTAVGRRLSRDPSFLQSSPPDINSRRSSYLDVVGGQKLSAVKSPVLSIENISDCSLSDNPMDMVRKLSDVESIGRKLATLPKYTNKSTLNVLDNDLIRRKSDIILSSNNKFGSTEIVPIETAKSVHNIPDSTTSKQDHDEIQLSVAKTLSNDEIMRRNQMTIQQLQNKLKNPKPSTSQPQKNNQTNPHIRIEIEDTSKPPSGPPPLAPKPKKIKQRHRSLGDHHNTQNQNKHQKLEGHSQSLDSSHPPKSSPEAKKPSRLSNPSQNRRPSSSRSSSLEKSRPPPTSSRTTSLDQSQPHHSVPTRTSSLDTSQAHHPTPSTRTSSLDKSQSRPPPSNRTSSLDKSQSRPPSNRTSSLDKAQSRPPSSRTSSLDKSQNRRTTSLDKSDGRRSRRNSSRCEEHDLPPAPPPPNCSPRNSNGKSPLERLSKDELVLLWRSSESELRSHLLKALRDKDVDDPP